MWPEEERFDCLDGPWRECAELSRRPNKGRKVGKQAQMIPVDCSMVVQIEGCTIV